MVTDKILKLVHAKMDEQKSSEIECIATTYVEILKDVNRFFFIFDGFTFTCEIKSEDRIEITGDFIWLPLFKFVLTEKYNTTHMVSVNGYDVIEIELVENTRKS